MKPLFFALCVCALLGFSGCESVRNDIGSGLREKFTGPVYQTRNFSSDAAPLFEAVKAVTERMGFRLTRTGQAQGVVEGVSIVSVDDRLRGAYQRTIKVRMVNTLDRGIEVGVLFTEIVEADSNRGSGQGVETSLHDSPLYDVFFANLRTELIR